MNFLLRSTRHVSPHLPSVPEVEPHHEDEHPAHERATTFEGLIAEDPFPNPAIEDGDREGDGIRDTNGASADRNSESQVPVNDHSDVAEDDGWITIPRSNLRTQKFDFNRIMGAS